METTIYRIPFPFPFPVIPAKAGIQGTMPYSPLMDSGLRRNDGVLW